MDCESDVSFEDISNGGKCGLCAQPIAKGRFLDHIKTKTHRANHKDAIYCCLKRNCNCCVPNLWKVEGTRMSLLHHIEHRHNGDYFCFHHILPDKFVKGDNFPIDPNDRKELRYCLRILDASSYEKHMKKFHPSLKIEK